MNLTTDPWIPIVWSNGKSELISLNDAFAHGEEIADLAVRPHERIALMRLLICIAQAALDGPKDEEDWKACQARLISTALPYLEQWKSVFELFGDGPRFLQLSGLSLDPSKKKKDEDDEESSLSKLDLALATGNNSTLFDNAGGSDRPFTPAQLALMLLAFQCFSPSGRIGVALWKGEKTPGNGSSSHAPCTAGNMLHTLIRGNNLVESIHRNMLTKKIISRFTDENRWGIPIWAMFPKSFGDNLAIENATMTYLGRLVPLSRSILLNSDGLLLGNGLAYPSFPEWRESSASVIAQKTRGGEQRNILSLSLEKAIWRELHALVVKALDRNSNGGPLCLLLHDPSEPVDIWTGGFVTDKAKPLDTNESVFHVPANMFSSSSQDVYEKGIEWAQHLAWKLRSAVSVFHKQLGDQLDRREARERAMTIKGKAMRFFWTTAEGHLDRLFELAGIGLQPESWKKTAWGSMLWRALLDAYSYSCPHETPRQMQAYALGLKTLTESKDFNNQVAEREEVA